jgi:hypothetical protein
MFVFGSDVQSIHFQANCHRYQMSQWTKRPVEKIRLSLKVQWTFRGWMLRQVSSQLPCHHSPTPISRFFSSSMNWVGTCHAKIRSEECNYNIRYKRFRAKQEPQIADLESKSRVHHNVEYQIITKYSCWSRTRGLRPPFAGHQYQEVLPRGCDLPLQTRDRCFDLRVICQVWAMAKRLFVTPNNSAAFLPDIPGLGCAVIFASERNEAKRKRNFFRFDAKKSDFFACFASMRNVETWIETKMKQSENETKKKRNCRNFRFEAKWSETEAKFFSLRCEKSVWKWIEAKKQKISENFKAKKDEVKFWDNL